ncbi:MAG: hypothetical protein HUU54_06010 [Ignavibacteriaceae bacterium]|nr:hypothetical protein [Ignavibacteriaceae bacterium]
MKYYISTFVLLAFAFIGCGDKLDLDDFISSGGTTNITGDTIYVQISPVWGGFNNPQDIIVGKEPFIYVADTDNNRIVMMNLNGQVLSTKSVPKPVALAQDYQFNLIVCGTFDTTLSTGETRTYSAVYKIDMAGALHDLSAAQMNRILPRYNVSSDYQFPDRVYTSVCTFYDNSFYIGRKGPNNTSIIDPDNSILIFQKKNLPGGAKADTLIGRLPLLNPIGTGLLSVNNLSALASFNRRSVDFIMGMTGENSFRAQWMTFVVTSEFAGYQNRLDPGSGGAEMMKVNKFISPEGITIDNANNIYIADTGKDSIYKFNSFGDEKESFGGPGIFNNPSGVAHFDRTLYVADAGNNRILRFVLSTDMR